MIVDGPARVSKACADHDAGIAGIYQIVRFYRRWSTIATITRLVRTAVTQATAISLTVTATSSAQRVHAGARIGPIHIRPA